MDSDMVRMSKITKMDRDMIGMVKIALMARDVVAMSKCVRVEILDVPRSNSNHRRESQSLGNLLPTTPLILGT